MEPIRRRLAILLTLTALACATACGNKGDLVRPADVLTPAPVAAADS